MKLYNLCSEPKGSHPEDGSWIAVWANTPDEAVAIAQQREHDPWFVVGEIESLGDEPSLPSVEERDAVLRKLGWRCECDSSCDTCGLAEMDGQFPVCELCNQCSECGCICEPDDSVESERRKQGENDTLPLFNKCTRDGCDGEIDFADMSEVWDGEEAYCDTCGCPHVAVAYEDAMRVHARDYEPGEL